MSSSYRPGRASARPPHSTPRLVAAAVAVLCIALPAASRADTRYRLVDLGLNAVANSIDAAGEIAGSPDYWHAGIYRDGAWHAMPGQQVVAINAGGDAVGIAAGIDEHGKPYFYPAGGGDPVRLKSPFKTGLPMQVTGIDAGGLVFGHGTAAKSSKSRCVLWQDFVPTVLDTQAHQCWSAGLNDAGQLAGTVTVNEKKPHYNAFVWTNGTLQRVGTLTGYRSTEAYGINAAGHLAVLAETHERHKNPPHRGVFWDGTTLRDLGTFDGSGNSTADAINDLDDIVGMAHDVDGADHPFVWHGAGLVALEPLVDGAGGWHIGEPSAIDDAGVIAGVGQFDGSSHGYMLVPE
jgi:uncharacterized membrane protein